MSGGFSDGFSSGFGGVFSSGYGAAMRVARISIYDGAFRLIGFITTARSINRSYLLHEVGQAYVEIAASDPLIEETDPLLGRVIVFQSDVYPLPWVGMLTVREIEKAGGTVTLRAKTFDAILNHRGLPNRYEASGTAGEAMLGVLATVNAMNPTGIGTGAIQNHGDRVDGLSFPNTKAMQAINKIGEAGGLEWWLDADVFADNISLTFRIARSRGFNLFREVALVEGQQVDWERCKEDGEAAVFSYTVIAGQTSVTESFTERSRSTAIVEEGGGFIEQFSGGHAIAAGGDTGGGDFHSSAITGTGAFGFDPGVSTFVQNPITRREVIVIREEAKTRDITVQSSSALLSRRQLSERLVSLRVLPGDHWAQLAPGNVVRLVLPTAFITGFDGPARVLGFQPMDEAGEAELVAELFQEVN